MGLGRWSPWVWVWPALFSSDHGTESISGPQFLHTCREGASVFLVPSKPWWCSSITFKVNERWTDLVSIFRRQWYEGNRKAHLSRGMYWRYQWYPRTVRSGHHLVQIVPSHRPLQQFWVLTIGLSCSNEKCPNGHKWPARPWLPGCLFTPSAQGHPTSTSDSTPKTQTLQLA